MNTPKNEPLVSVIIPTYNREKLLSRAVDSVLKQTYPGYELIVVDDCSTDNTMDLVKTYIDNSPKIKYIKLSQNSGPSVARNEGLRNAKGDYIAFLDSDDEWLPRKLELQLKKFGDSNIQNLGVVYGGGIINTGKKEERCKPEYSGKYRFDKKIPEICFTGPSNYLFKKEVFDVCGVFDEDGLARKGGEDLDMFFRVFLHYNIDFIKEYVVIHYSHENSLTSQTTPIENIRYLEYRINKHEKLYALNNPRELNRIYSIIGNFYCYSGEMQKGRTNLIKAIKYNKFNLKAYLFLMLALLGDKIYQACHNIFSMIRWGKEVKRK